MPSYSRIVRRRVSGWVQLLGSGCVRIGLSLPFAASFLAGRASPLFDADWYTTTYPGVARPEAAWQHYLTRGQPRGLQPNPLFRPDWYLERYPDLGRWRIDPLRHYLSFGGFEGRDPGPDFDSDWYLKSYPDVAAVGVNPLYHYLIHGRIERRLPRTGYDPATAFLPAQAAAVEADSLFDARWYVSRYPDVASSGLDPLEHYRVAGARDGRAPNPLFDVAAYLHDNPDVDRYGGDVLIHYAKVGRDRGATPHPLFDPDWYARQYGDFAGRDPYEHYLHVGLAKGRAPSPAVPEGTDVRVGVTALPPAPVGETRVTIILAAQRSAALTLRCLDAIARHAPKDAGVRVVLVDPDPAHPLREVLGDTTRLDIVTDGTDLGFLSACNAGARRADSEYLVFLDGGSLVLAGSLEALLETAENDEQVGIVGARTIEPTGRLHDAGIVVFRDGRCYPFGRGGDPSAPAYGYRREIDAVDAAAFLVRRQAWEAVGGFDTEYPEGRYGVVDHSFSVASAGWKIVYQPDTSVIRARMDRVETDAPKRQPDVGQARFVTRWADELATRFEGLDDLFLARQRPKPRGTILVVDDSVPQYDRHAGALTTFQYLRLLTEEGFRVIYLPDNGLRSEPYTGVLQRLGIEVLFGGLDIGDWYADNGVFLDWVILARPDVAARHLSHVRRRSRARVLYYTHDVHSLRERRRFEVSGDPSALVASERLLAVERDIYRGVDCVMTPSTDEVSVIRELAPEADIRVLTPFFWPPGPPAQTSAPPLDERRDIVFLGSYQHTPNVDAAIVLVREIMPLVWRQLPHARAVLVGADVSPAVAQLAEARVEVTGHVPDLEAVWARARMSVSPLRYGAGVKGKIIEALRAGVPVITTPIGNEGIALKSGVEALIGETPAAIADHIIRLYQDPTTLAALAAAGKRVVDERFSRERARSEILAALGSPLQNRTVPVSADEAGLRS